MGGFSTLCGWAQLRLGFLHHHDFFVQRTDFSVNNFADRAEYCRNITGPRDSAQLVLGSVIGDERGGIPLIRLQSGANGLRIIVFTMFEFFAPALIADAFLGRGREELVENRATLRTGQATRDAFDDHIIIHGKMQDELYRASKPAQACVQFLSLRDAAGKSIEHESPAAFRCPQPVCDRIDHNIVRNQFSCRHHRGDFLADLGLIGHRGSQDISRRNLGNTILFGHHLGLGAFSRSGNSEQNNPHTALSANLAGPLRCDPF